MPSYIFYVDLVVFAIAALYVFTRLRRSPLPLPPGPKPKMLLGNLGDMPEKDEWLTYTSWKQKYGHCFPKLGTVLSHIQSSQQEKLSLSASSLARSLSSTAFAWLMLYLTSVQTFTLVVRYSQWRWTCACQSPSPFVLFARSKSESLRAGFDWGITLLQNNSLFKYQRRMFEQQFRPGIVDQYAPKQIRATVVLLNYLLETPSEFMDHIRQ